MWTSLRHGYVLTALTAATLALGTGCSQAKCEPGLCPIGTTCEASSGLCTAQAQGTTATPGLLGHSTFLRMPDGQLGVIGFAPDRGSLVLLTHGIEADQTSLIAGTGVGGEQAAAGQASAAGLDSHGTLHVAWWRASDSSINYAALGSKGWQRDATPLAAAGTAGRDLSLATDAQNVWVAWQNLDPPGVRLAHRVGSVWQTEDMPQPPDLPGNLGGSVSLAMLPLGPAVATYDSAGGDLVLGARANGTWTVARLDGRDPSTGADTGDVGSTCALAAGLAGDLVVAYRDRTRGRVLLARNHAGVLQRLVVAGGLVQDPETGLKRVPLSGTALAVVVLPSDRAVVAWQDGSAMQVHLAVEQPSGDFSSISIAQDGIQAWPSLLLLPDHSLVAAWIALHPERGPGAGVATWTGVATTGAP